MTSITVDAHPNIALVKYWGKQPGTTDVPSAPSLSITLGDLTTTTTVAESKADKVVLNGQVVHDPKIDAWIGKTRLDYGIPTLEIHSHSNFPVASGLASSAAGFCALALGINQLCELNLSQQDLFALARSGSVSAARSFFGGYVILDPRNSRKIPAQLHAPEHWDLRVVIAIAAQKQKSIGSTRGMAQTVATSPFYSSWIQATETDYEAAIRAIDDKNFTALADITERSCHQLHAVMLTTQPPLLYWNSGTLAGISTIRRLQRDHVPVFFTSDAGPQLKAICLPSAVNTVRQQLANTKGILDVMVSRLGNDPIVG